MDIHQQLIMNYILLQPDNSFAICSPDKKELILVNAQRENIVQEFIDSAASIIRDEANRIIDALLSGENPYKENVNYVDVLVSQYFYDSAPFQQAITEFKEDYPILWEKAVIKYFSGLKLLENGTKVKTRETSIKGSGWTASALLKRKFGVSGVVIGYHDGHGLCYEVQHADGTDGCYDPWELEIL